MTIDAYLVELERLLPRTARLRALARGARPSARFGGAVPRVWGVSG